MTAANRAIAVPDSRRDPWRRTMGLNLRSEAAKFILTAFNVDVFSDQPPGSVVSLSNGMTERWFAERLARFLSQEPEAHWGLEHQRFITLRVPKSAADVTACEYAPDGALRKVTPFFDPNAPEQAFPADAAHACRAVIEAFNKTRLMPETKRPQELARMVRHGLPDAAQRYAGRILASTAVSFQDAPRKPLERFDPPDFRLHRGFGIGPMAVACRRSPDGRGVDVWLQCHHAASDGGPVQEMLDRLEKNWGVTEPLVLPADDPGRKIEPRECHVEQERRVALITDFIDFSPLQELRRELAAQMTPEAVPLVSLLMWCLSHQPEFAGAGINTAVDLPASEDMARAVDLVAVLPQKFHGQPDGFTSYIKRLNRLFADARVRKTETWKLLTRLNSMPAFLGITMLRWNENGTRKAFGTLTVSLVKGTKMVIAPIPDSAWDHGFIAIGTVGVPGAGGKPVTPVSIKGEPEKVGAYPAAIRRAIAQCRSLVRAAGAE